MASQPQNSEKTVYVEYCRSCETHSWCTHHDQAKYHDTFLKLSQMIAQRFPNLQVIGNMVPSYLIPFKIAENKYIDSQTNKYVVYPQIGSFQVVYNNSIVYSKKDSNAWPNFQAIVSKIGTIVDPNYKSPPKMEKLSISPPKDVLSITEKQMHIGQFAKSNDEKATVYKDQSKGFTLTDHFKLYRPMPKFEDKDWLTEKKQSESSIKQFFDLNRGQSRQKSDNSEDTKRKRDFGGQTKLKQMLKNKGLMIKEQGKKEMVIKLDSIEQENAYYEEGNGATQRNQQLSTKKNRLQELEDQFSSLQNKFINFENKVQDIHIKNRQFQYNQQVSNEHSRFKPATEALNYEHIRKESQKQQGGQKENYFSYERFTKLDQYLKASEQEKNEKLHKIYGEWKMLKKTAQKNRVILKNKEKVSQDREVSQYEQSRTHSNSPSYIANVITFKPTKGKSTNKFFGGSNSLNKQLGHKYSTLQRYDSNKVLASQPKFRTAEQFYSKIRKNKQNLSSQTDQQINPASKLLKKGLGTMSMQALKKMASRQALFNIQKLGKQQFLEADHNQKMGNNQISQFSQPAKKNIKHIQSRINDIQNKLRIQKERQDGPLLNKPTLDALQKIYSNKSKSLSQNSNYSSKNEGSQRRKKQMIVKKNQNNYKNSYKNPNEKEFRKINKKKATNKESQSFQYRREANNSQAIQEQNELQQSKFESINESRMTETENQDHYAKDMTSLKKRKQGNSSLLARQVLYNQTTNSLKEAVYFKNVGKKLKTQSKIINAQQSKKLKIAKKTSQKQGSLQTESEYDVITEKQAGKINKSHQKQLSRHDFPLHEPVTYLRKQKDWRQSQPKKKSSNEKARRSSEQEQGEIVQINDEVNHKIQRFSRNNLSDSKQTVIKFKKHPKTKSKENQNTPKLKKLKSEESKPKQHQKQASKAGRIRKNRSRWQDSQRQKMQREDVQQNSENEQQRDVFENSQHQSQPQSAPNMQNQPEMQLQENNSSKQATYEEEYSVTKMSSKSQKGKIKKANKGYNLSFHKFQELCYEGYKNLRPQTSHFGQISNELTNQNKIKSHENALSSCKLDYQMVSFDKQNQGQKDQIQIIQDQKINSDQQTQINKKNLQPVISQVPQSNQLTNQVKILVNKLVTQSNQIVQPNTSQKQNFRQIQSIEQKDNQIQDNQILDVIKQKKKKKAQARKKQKEGKNKMQSKEVKKMPDRKDSQIDLQQLMAKQNGDYLSVKITNSVLEQKQPEKSVKQHQVLKKETNQYLDCELGINIIACPSALSLNIHEQKIPNSFMDYKSATQINFVEHEEANNQQSGKTAEEENQSQNSSNQQEFQVQEQSKYHSIKKNQQEEDVQPQVSDIFVNEMTNRVIVQFYPERNQEPESKQDPKSKYQSEFKEEEYSKQEEIIFKKSQNDQKKSQTLNVPEKTITIEKQAQSNLSQTTQKKLENKADIKNNKKHLKQQDNVYSQAKQKSKFKEIGIQKQLTLDISVQTDHPVQDYSADIFIARGNTMKSNQSHRQASNQQSQKRKAQLAQSIHEQSNPVKNNYFVQSKTQGMFQKKKAKKQMERAHIIDKIYSANVEAQASKFSNLLTGSEQEIIKDQGPVIKITEWYAKGELFSQKGLYIQLVQSRFSELLKVVQILCQKNQWLITRLFQDKNGILKETAFGVWLCKQYQWQCFILDDSILVNQENEPLYSTHKGNQLWFNVLEKAIAAALGGYANLMKAQTGELFTMLTGCNTITSKIKQDPNKNKKLLLLINECLRKNYVIHAEKNDKSKKQQQKQSIYFVNSLRRSGGDDQTLIQLSQNGRESFWIKLSKFVQQFCRIEILQLRINHNFAHIDLGVGRPGKLTVVQLEFEEDAQGFVTLAYLGESGALRAYLYKQEKNKVLKLVGQAKQKNRPHLFFQCAFTEGRYYVFAQIQERLSRLAFLGQSQPSLKITEEIHSEGLKNEMTQYLPVRESEQGKLKRSQYETQNQWRSRKPRLQDNFVQSHLRENFVQYVLGKSKL